MMEKARRMFLRFGHIATETILAKYVSTDETKHDSGIF